MTKSDDAALFELWLTTRNGDAFAELARRHAPVVYDIAARALGDRTAAEDVVQEALLDLAVEPTRKPAEVGVVAWLVRFAICRARNQRSSEKCRARRQQVVGLRRPEETMPDDHLELKEELDHALSAAEPEERAVLAMRYLHGWEYSKIAETLETSEGAARVRVHRALSSVRARLGVHAAEETKIARGMAGLALLPLPATKLDGMIAAALDAAKAPIAPVSRLSPGLRAGLHALGVVALLAGGVAASIELRTDGASSSTGTETAQLTRVVSGDSLAGPARGRVRQVETSAFAGAPRPENWDGGALARLARGERDLADVTRPARRVEQVAPAPAAAAAERPIHADVPLPAPVEESSSSAFRPSPRGASAANCDPGSLDGERADALVGFSRVVVVEPSSPAQEPVVEELGEPSQRIVSRGRTLSALDPNAQALVEEAAALVRTVVEQSDVDSAEDSGGDTVRRARRTGARAVRDGLREERHRDPAKSRAMARKAAKIRRVMSVLFRYALADGHTAGELRWPDGVDVASALQDVIRMLSTPSVQRRPGIVETGPGPSGPGDRRPDVQ